MRIPIAAACVFSFLVATACSLTCVKHISVYHEDQFEKSTGELINCSLEEDVCVMTFFTLQQRHDNKKNGFRYMRYCGPPSLCDMKESLTTAKYKIRYSTTCCNTDRCVPPLPVLPEENFIKNGVICPSCHSTPGKLCVPERAMECTGNETHCIYHNETIFQGDIFNQPKLILNGLDLNIKLSRNKDSFCLMSADTAQFKVQIVTSHSFGCGTANIFRDNGQTVSFFSSFSTSTVTEIKPNKNLETGNFLWCHVCHEEFAAICSKEQILCEPDEDVCLSENRRIIDEQTRRLTMQIRKRCGKSSECKFNGFITSKGKTLSIQTTCCDTDMCIPPEPLWRIKRRRNNGRTCPGCFPSNSSTCRPTDVIHCNGEENYCIYYSSHKTEGSVSTLDEFHGCSTAGVCETKTKKQSEYEYNSVTITTEILCSGGVRMIGHLLSIIVSECAAWSLGKL